MNNQTFSPLHLRHLRRADIIPAGQLAAAAFGSVQEGKLVAQMLTIHCGSAENLALNDQTNTLVANEYYGLFDATTGEIIGLSGLYRHLGSHPDVYWLNWFCIAPARQKQGLGRMLLEATLQKAISLGAVRMLIETWPDSTALPLYHSLGFEKCGLVPEYYDAETPLLLLTRSLRNVQFELPEGNHSEI